jgi:hypothetical protein
MDEWLAAVEADTRDVPLATKVVESRPDSVDHRCTDGNGNDVPAETCDALVESYSTPRFEAGMPLSDDILKCQLQPLEDFDYGEVEFTDEEWATLQEVFPTGVCDYDAQGVEWTETITWLTYADTIGGVPMGDPPASAPFGPAGAPQPAPTDAAPATPQPATSLPATGGGASLLAVFSLLLGLLVRRRAAHDRPSSRGPRAGRHYE